MTTAIMQEVKQKIHALITPKNLSVQPVLVHVNGVADAVEDADYFLALVRAKPDKVRPESCHSYSRTTTPASAIHRPGVRRFAADLCLERLVNSMDFD